MSYFRAVSETTEENETLSPDKQNARPPQADTGNSVKENGRGAPDAVEADEDASGLKTPPRRVFGIRCFVANLALLYFFQFAMIVYLFGVIRTMERRFGLDSRKSGVILSADDVVQICVVTFIGHFGKRASKPRIIGVLALSFAVGGTMLAMPYFLYGAQVQGATSARNFTYGGKPADPEVMVMMIDYMRKNSCNACHLSTCQHKDSTLKTMSVCVCACACACT